MWFAPGGQGIVSGGYHPLQRSHPDCTTEPTLDLQSHNYHLHTILSHQANPSPNLTCTVGSRTVAKAPAKHSQSHCGLLKRKPRLRLIPKHSWYCTKTPDSTPTTFLFFSITSWFFFSSLKNDIQQNVYINCGNHSSVWNTCTFQWNPFKYYSRLFICQERAVILIYKTMFWVSVSISFLNLWHVIFFLMYQLEPA